jgi:hypothetical protein
MTVASEPDHDGEHLCVWFYDGRPWRSYYPPEALAAAG